MEGRLEQSIREKYQLLAEHFDERERRLWAAVEAQQLGRGGISRWPTECVNENETSGCGN
jgi:hypothetical protein